MMIGGTADPHWVRPEQVGPSVEMVDVPAADHGLRTPGDWRSSLRDQLRIFERIGRFAATVASRPRVR